MCVRSACLFRAGRRFSPCRSIKKIRPVLGRTYTFATTRYNILTYAFPITGENRQNLLTSFFASALQLGRDLRFLIRLRRDPTIPGSLWDKTRPTFFVIVFELFIFPPPSKQFHPRSCATSTAYHATMMYFSASSAFCQPFSENLVSRPEPDVKRLKRKSGLLDMQPTVYYLSDLFE